MGSTEGVPAPGVCAIPPTCIFQPPCFRLRTTCQTGDHGEVLPRKEEGRGEGREGGGQRKTEVLAELENRNPGGGGPCVVLTDQEFRGCQAVVAVLGQRGTNSPGPCPLLRVDGDIRQMNISLLRTRALKRGASPSE